MIRDLALQREHVTVAVDNAGFRRPQRSRAAKLRLPRHGRGGADQLKAFDAIPLSRRVDALDLGNLTRAGRDDQLAALLMSDAARLEISIEQTPPLDAHAMAQAARRIVHAGMDDFGIARRRARTDGARRLDHQNVLPVPRESGRHRQAYGACSHDDNVNIH